MGKIWACLCWEGKPFDRGIKDRVKWYIGVIGWGHWRQRGWEPKAQWEVSLEQKEGPPFHVDRGMRGWRRNRCQCLQNLPTRKVVDKSYLLIFIFSGNIFGVKEDVEGNFKKSQCLVWWADASEKGSSGDQHWVPCRWRPSILDVLLARLLLFPAVVSSPLLCRSEQIFKN